jgi:hypothetical protein
MALARRLAKDASLSGVLVVCILPSYEHGSGVSPAGYLTEVARLFEPLVELVQSTAYRARGDVYACISTLVAAYLRIAQPGTAPPAFVRVPPCVVDVGCFYINVRV